ncbi:MoxR family ATPase [Anaerolineales bacterium HSG24]|nr:MoxR family ATPase [Anaerolineales bacterium HSG24]
MSSSPTAITNTIKKKLAARQYIGSDRIATMLYLAEKLNKPILCEGPAGVGKTELSKIWSAITGRRFIRLQCYEGLDESKALYEWEYAKQMLYTQLLRDQLKMIVGDVTNLKEAAQRVAAEESVFFSKQFLLPRPLLQALTSNKPALLLIDEIDRAEVEFEAFLLEILSEFQVTIPELGTIRAKHQPIVFLTSNNTRELSEALKRRCLYLFITYPTIDQELNIVQMKVPQLAEQLQHDLVELVHRIRQFDLRKLPSIGETIDWARALVELNATDLDSETVKNSLSILLKHETDIVKVEQELNYEL